ncbi:hypothetical protein F4861DRAFT_402667 [Xylaria intraflava]|nr:hypothetical protein F4861DRAFT_402667 [Xylaria intraflava]
MGGVTSYIVATTRCPRRHQSAWCGEVVARLHGTCILPPRGIRTHGMGGHTSSHIPHVLWVYLHQYIITYMYTWLAQLPRPSVQVGYTSAEQLVSDTELREHRPADRESLQIGQFGLTRGTLALPEQIVFCKRTSPPRMLFMRIRDGKGSRKAAGRQPEASRANKTSPSVGENGRWSRLAAFGVCVGPVSFFADILPISATRISRPIAALHVDCQDFRPVCSLTSAWPGGQGGSSGLGSHSFAVPTIGRAPGAATPIYPHAEADLLSPRRGEVRPGSDSDGGDVQASAQPLEVVGQRWMGMP